MQSEAAAAPPPGAQALAVTLGAVGAQPYLPAYCDGPLAPHGGCVPRLPSARCTLSGATAAAAICFRLGRRENRKCYCCFGTWWWCHKLDALELCFCRHYKLRYVLRGATADTNRPQDHNNVILTSRTGCGAAQAAAVGQVHDAPLEPTKFGGVTFRVSRGSEEPGGGWR